MFNLSDKNSKEFREEFVLLGEKYNEKFGAWQLQQFLLWSIIYWVMQSSKDIKHFRGRLEVAIERAEEELMKDK